LQVFAAPKDYGVWRLPFGRGMKFGKQMNKILDAVAGGRQCGDSIQAGDATNSQGHLQVRFDLRQRRIFEIFQEMMLTWRQVSERSREKGARW
jgi:hypothetical protein